MAGEFTEAGAVLLADVLAALEKGAQEIMLVADHLVPKDTETLRESARIFAPSMDPSPGVTFGFGFGGGINPKTGNAVEEYTVPVHEQTEVFHEPPTTAKFLEDPLFAYAGVMEGSLAAELRVTWGHRTPGSLRHIARGAMTHFPTFGGGYSVRDIAGRFARMQ